MEDAKRRFPWLLALALGALLAALLVPGSRWLVVEQFHAITQPPVRLAGMLKDLGVKEGAPNVDTQPLRQRLIETARRHPDDPQIQTVFAMQRGWEQIEAARSTSSFTDFRLLNLRVLAARFPDNPALRAHILRSACMGSVRAGHEMEQGLLTGSPPVNNAFQPRPLDPQVLADFDRDAAAGERLDPDNAFFPFMRALGLYGAKRDREARAALHRAASKPRWEDYVFDEARGRLRVQEEATGDRTALSHLAVQVAILFPHYAQCRAVARVATYQAIQAEAAGRRREGLEIRRDITRLGGLMRAESRSIIGSLVGIAIVQVATTRPGGVPWQPTRPSAAQEVIRQQRVTEYTAYLDRRMDLEESRRIQAEFTAGQQVRNIVNKGTALGPMSGTPLIRLLVWWNATLIVLADAFWLLILAGFAALLARTRYADGAAPAAVAITALALLTAMMWQSGWVQAAAVMLNVMGNLTAGSAAPGWMPRNLPPESIRIMAALTALLIPLLLVITVGIISVLRRRPLSHMLARGCSVAGSLFLLLYLGLMLNTLQQENRMSAALARTMQHEGRFYAELTGLKWPGKL